MPLGTYDLVQNILIVLIMPFIIWANLRNYGFRAPLNQYLWNEHTNLMRTSLIVLTLITLYSALELLRHYGFVSDDVSDIAVPIIGVPFLVVGVALLYFAVRSLIKVMRARSA